MVKTLLGRCTALWVSRISLVIALAVCNRNQVYTAQTVSTLKQGASKLSVAPMPASTAVGALAQNDLPAYLDDRSNPVQLLKSYYNAINRKEYVRAYYYWGQNGKNTTSQPPPYPQFEAGYAKTKAVQLTTGKMTSDAAMQKVSFQVPVTLVTTQTDGSKQTFVGCYTIRQVSPLAFGAPPFKPMYINSAKIQQVPNKANTALLMQQSCS